MAAAQYKIHKMPVMPSKYDELNVGITTRVLNKKMQERRASILSDISTSSCTSGYGKNIRDSFAMYQRRPSVLEGTQLPNSMPTKYLKEDNLYYDLEENLKHFTQMKEKDDFVDDIIRKIRAEEEKRKDGDKLLEDSKDREEWDRIMYDKIQRQLALLRKMDDYENARNKPITLNKSGTINSEDETRINRRTGMLESISRDSRRSTLDSIKSAIEKSPAIQHLINVDKLEKEMNQPNTIKQQDSIDKAFQEVPTKFGAKGLTNRKSQVRSPTKRSLNSPSNTQFQNLSNMLGKDSEKPRRKSILKHSSTESGSSNVAAIGSGRKKRVSILPKRESFTIFDTDFKAKVRNPKPKSTPVKNSLAMKLRTEPIRRVTRRTVKVEP